MTLYSIKDAVERKIDRLRLPKWAHPMDHIRINLIDGTYGPWAHFHSPMNKSLHKRDPYDILIFQDDSINNIHLNPFDKCWEAYGGILPESKEWLEEEASYEKTLA